ncbi:hypothetical protein FNJ84_18205 [Paracoccus sp. M683]|uniref:hypothetical protein n=1 Tax=Paracoccus sp. M683 TaxID=2594268 RepID=UPI00117D360F|nr:hypothetical protein [Paracoccus sp. M683]TRW94800.1 hypothetical protein FNJ84_18205 [Paracoccus sp. M683]
MTKNVFLSVGGTANEAQEKFVAALEARLRAEGLVPNTVGRNTFSADAPLKTVENLMSSCDGTIVLALERTLLERGVERRGGPKERALSGVRFATPWNQIEAAMSYAYGKPLLVIVEDGVKAEGLLEPGYDWYVQSVPLETASLNSIEFNGVLASWKQKISALPGKEKPAAPSPGDMTIAELVGAMKPKQLWSLIGVASGVVAGAFAFGAKLLP